jgi:tetratricopeptide (TPR) repeat protein
MMNRCKIWMLIFGLLTVQAVQAQDDFIQRADKLYKNQIYDQAADMYLTYLQQTYNYEINLKLAECYRLMHSTVDAEYWYGVIVTQNTADPDILRRYADLLKTNGKYRSAKEYYLKYAAYEEDGYYYAASCDWAITNRTKSPAYFIDTLGFNTTDSELTPTFYKKGLIYARSTGNKINPTTGVSFYDLYYTELRNDSLWIISPMQNVNSEVHEAAPYYDSNDQKLYFTRNNHYRGRTIKSSDGEVKLELYFSTSVDNKFTGPRPVSVNSKTYSVGQPTVSPDGKVLIFASDKPGGYGGTDLYFCTKKGNDWSNAKNLGPAINTKGDELYPSMSPEGVLFFASNYHPGFGGFDIF